MSMQRIPYRSKKTGELKVYEYIQRSYYVTEIERCRTYLRYRPLKMMPARKGDGVVWASLNGKKQFKDVTIIKLIAEGYAVCLGNFVEKKGVVR